MGGLLNPVSINALCEFWRTTAFFFLFFFNNSTVCCWNDSLRKGYVYCKIMYIWRISSFILWIYLWHNLTINCLFFFMKQLLVLTQTYTKYLTIIMALLKSRGRKCAGKHILLRLYFLFLEFLFQCVRWSLGLMGTIWTFYAIMRQTRFWGKTSEGRPVKEIENTDELDDSMI